MICAKALGWKRACAVRTQRRPVWEEREGEQVWPSMRRVEWRAFYLHAGEIRRLGEGGRSMNTYSHIRCSDFRGISASAGGVQASDCGSPWCAIFWTTPGFHGPCPSWPERHMLVSISRGEAGSGAPSLGILSSLCRPSPRLECPHSFLLCLPGRKCVPWRQELVGFPHCWSLLFKPTSASVHAHSVALLWFLLSL